MQLTAQTLALIVLAVVGLLVLIMFFLLGMQFHQVDDTTIFTTGCIVYCNEIQKESLETEEPLSSIAVRKAEQLENDPFIKSCYNLFSEIDGFPWKCWNRPGCCKFNLPNAP
jgi:hypothetical protein